MLNRYSFGRIGLQNGSDEIVSLFANFAYFFVFTVEDHVVKLIEIVMIKWERS